MTRPKTTLESLEVKLDLLMKKMDDFSAVQARVDSLETTVHDLSKSVTLLHKEIIGLKEQSNNRDQQARGLSIRLYGIAQTDEETDEKALTKRVYETVLKPVLAAAKTNKLIDVLPQLSNTITAVYRVRVPAAQSRIPGQPPPPPAPIIVKFSNPAIRLAFLRSKKTGFPPPTEIDVYAGTKRYSASEDLTGPTYKLFREMVGSDLVEKVWSIDGRLRFTVPGDKSARRVKSVFTKLADILNSD